MLNERTSILDNEGFRSQLGSILCLGKSQLGSTLCLGKEDKAKNNKIQQIQQLDDKALSVLRAIYELKKATVKEIYTKTFLSKDPGYRICKQLEKQGFLLREEDSSKYPNVKPTIYYSISPDFQELLAEAYNAQKQGITANSVDPEIKKLDALEIKIANLKPSAKKVFDLLNDKGITANAMADKIGCHFSTVHKSFQKFIEMGIATRETPKQQTGHGREGYIFYATPLAMKLKQRNNREMNTSQETQDIYFTNSDSAESQSFQASYSDKVCELLDATEKFEQIVKEMISMQGDEAKKIISKMISKIQSHSE
ncbi:MAG: hypothetical protein QNJ63_26230 [Calothrix sp. MO_192.B10]|nr:hypothetical protein [Calothrix sp. MO_192.B10]